MKVFLFISNNAGSGSEKKWKGKKRLLFAGSMIFALCLQMAGAAEFRDDFDRADSGASNDAEISIGEHYSLVSGADSTALATGAVIGGELSIGQTAATARNIALIYNGIELPSVQTGGTFEISVDIKVHTIESTSLFYGLVFNYQTQGEEKGSFYTLRMRTGNPIALQMVRFDGEHVARGSKSVSCPSPLVPGAVYRLTVKGSPGGPVHYSLSGEGLGENGVSGEIPLLGKPVLSGGVAGLTISTGVSQVRFDNFCISTGN